MSDSDAVTRLVARIGRENPNTTTRAGVSVVARYDPATARVYLAEIDAADVPLRHLRGITPAPGDQVLVLKMGRLWLVIGVIA